VSLPAATRRRKRLPQRGGIEIACRTSRYADRMVAGALGSASRWVWVCAAEGRVTGEMIFLFSRNELNGAMHGGMRSWGEGRRGRDGRQVGADARC